jgi:RimJ/RimL family protein N-acetyltransferase
MQKNYIANYSVTERLHDGRQVTIRAIRPDDMGRMADALREMSPESLYRRTFSAKRTLSDDELRQLTEVDFENVVALVAVINEEAKGRIVGGGRFIRTGEGGTALKSEVAFLIDDAHQGLGIGSSILRHLVIIARASGVTQFEAEMLPTNEGMLRVFARSGIPFTKTLKRDTVYILMDLTNQEEGSAARQPLSQKR